MTIGVHSTLSAGSVRRNLLSLICATVAIACPVSAEPAFVSLATGAVSGVYYPTGAAICEVVNASGLTPPLRCSVESTPGSVYNVETLTTGENEFAIVQSDVQSLAVKGLQHWNGRAEDRLRSVMALYPEVMTIIARPDAGITNIEDLRGKRVNIGARGSGTRATWDEIRNALGFTDQDLAEAAEIRQDSAIERLCAGDLDASLMVVGHPSGLVARELATCGLVLVNASGEKIAALIDSKPYFVTATIPAATYGMAGDVMTIGIEATILTTSNAPEDVVYAFTKSVLENVEKLKNGQPVLAKLQAAEMAGQSMTAPLHPGAERAYRELGLLK